MALRSHQAPSTFALSGSGFGPGLADEINRTTDTYDTFRYDNLDRLLSVTSKDNTRRGTENGETSIQYFLANGVIVIKRNGSFAYYQGFADQQGSILRVYDGNGQTVFDSRYDAWGKQRVIKNTIALRRGYTGHEMLTEFGLVDMKGRVYDPALGRFLSPDNYVQAPTNSQSFNRYSYCINNPLKYTDPSGELFGIDNIFFALFNMASSMIQAAANGKNVWKAAGLSILSSAATFGLNLAAGAIGDAFGHSIGSLGNELGRATCHGLTNSLSYIVRGDNLGAGFLSGFSSSLIGSCIQSFGLSKNGIIGLMSIAGCLSSSSAGGSLIYGLTAGMTIGMRNHTWEEDGIIYNDDYGLMGFIPDVVIMPSKSYSLSVSTKFGIAGEGLEGLRKFWVDGITTSQKSKMTYQYTKIAKKYGYKINCKNAELYRNRIPKFLKGASNNLGIAGFTINTSENVYDVINNKKIGLGNFIEVGTDAISIACPVIGFAYFGADYLYYLYSGETIYTSLNKYTLYDWR